MARPLIAALALLLVFATAAPTPAGAGPTQLARFGGGRSFGGGGLFRSRPRSRAFGAPRRRGLASRILHALAIGYLLHLLFTTPGGLLILLLLILVVVWALRRMRRSAYPRY